MSKVKMILNKVGDTGYILGYAGIALMCISMAGGAIINIVKKH